MLWGTFEVKNFIVHNAICDGIRGYSVHLRAEVDARMIFIRRPIEAVPVGQVGFGHAAKPGCR